jgi:vancomycin resistance protein YoaR
MSQTSQVLPLKILRASVPSFILAVIIVLGSFLVTVIFGLLAYQVYFLNRVHLGVQINEVEVSQMTPFEVRQLVAKQAKDLLDRPITLLSDEETFTFTAAELGAQVDIERTIELAFSVGRQGPFLTDLRSQLQTMSQPVQIVPVVTFDTGPANNALLNLAHTLDRPTRDAQLLWHDDLSLEVIPAQTGRTLDIEASRALIRKAIILRTDNPVNLVLHTYEPLIIEAEPAHQQLEALLSRPLVFIFNERSWSLSPETLAEMVIIGQQWHEGGPGRVTVSFNQATLAAHFHDLALQINQPAIDAWFDLNEETWTLHPIKTSQNGYSLDVTAAMTMANGVLQTPGRRHLALPVLIESPAVPMENPEQLGIKELVSSATSYFKGSSTERMQNIQVSASKFHGLVIPPGEVFSFNQHLGDVTAENGFVESLIIQGDRTAVGVGGGVCQVSTTAFRSAFFGGFEIVERWAHGYRVGWYETGSSPGLDATIYSPNVDFKFRNDTNSYILIQTDTDLTAGTITFNFYGASPNRTVTISEPLESNKVPHGPDIYQEDASLEPDEVKQVDWAQDGVDITIYRTVLEGDKVIHKDTLFSRYRPWQNIYKVGPTSKEDKE